MLSKYYLLISKRGYKDMNRKEIHLIDSISENGCHTDMIQRCIFDRQDRKVDVALVVHVKKVDVRRHCIAQGQSSVSRK